MTFDFLEQVPRCTSCHGRWWPRQLDLEIEIKIYRKTGGAPIVVFEFRIQQDKCHRTELNWSLTEIEGCRNRTRDLSVLSRHQLQPSSYQCFFVQVSLNLWYSNTIAKDNFLFYHSPLAPNDTFSVFPYHFIPKEKKFQSWDQTQFLLLFKWPLY